MSQYYFLRCFDQINAPLVSTFESIVAKIEFVCPRN